MVLLGHMDDSSGAYSERSIADLPSDSDSDDCDHRRIHMSRTMKVNYHISRDYTKPVEIKLPDFLYARSWHIHDETDEYIELYTINKKEIEKLKNYSIVLIETNGDIQESRVEKIIGGHPEFLSEIGQEYRLRCYTDLTKDLELVKETRITTHSDLKI